MSAKTTSLPPQASIVVIGGGVIGCSTLYHLAKAGINDAILLERKQLTCGTTWHSAAQVRQLRSTNNLTQLIKYSSQLYAGLEQETGQSTGWTRTGSLSIATNPDRMTHIKRQAALARLFDVEAEIIGRDDAAKLWPMMRADDIVGAVFSPNDGRVNPSDLCAALVKGAKANGARVFEDTAVTGFDIRQGRVCGVNTEAGDIACEKVVNCAGLWGRQIGALAGVSVPLYACEHFYLLTKPIEGMQAHMPTLSDHDGYLYLRDEVGGLLAGCFEPNAKPLPLENLPRDFAFDLLNEDWDHFEPMMMNALHRIPSLETAEVRMLLNGPESFTPDGAFLLGEAPEVDGFFVGCGMNSVGVASGGGVGRALAEWVIAGEQPMDLSSVDIRRFAPFHSDEQFLQERIPEELGLHYAIGFPGRELETARNQRLGPLHDRLVAKGARFGVRMGWERANYFPDPNFPDPTPLSFGRAAWHDAVARECHAARNTVALFDQSSFAKLLVEGRDAAQVLQRLAANNVAVPAGKVVYTSLLNDRGGIESDLTIFPLGPERFLLVTGTAQPVHDRHWIRRNLEPGEQVTITDVTEDTAVLSVMGPKSRDLLSRLSGADLTNEAFPQFTFRDIQVGPASVRAARLSYVGELGWELYVPADLALALYDALFETGADLGIRDAGGFALTALRIEKGYRAWGHELSCEETPLEAGLGFATKLNTDLPFMGREALERQRGEGVAKRLVHFVLDDETAYPLGDEPILQNGAPVGQLTSAAFGHTLGRSVAMGYIRLNGRSAADAVAQGGFEIDIARDPAAASASLKPPYDPSGERMKG